MDPQAETQHPPEPGSGTERREFARLQDRLRPLFERVFPNRLEPRTVVVVPSLSLDPEVLENIVGVEHYEERMLCMLMLLRLPKTRVIYVTSTPIHPAIVDYYLHLLPGIPGIHARQRLTMLSCHDAERRKTVTEKILERPGVLKRIREAIPDLESAHMTCFNATERERTLAVRLGIPLFACDPALLHLGYKSGSRKVFKQAGVLCPEGREDLRDMQDVVSALAELKTRQPNLRRCAVKLERGTSGEGNSTFSFDGSPDGGALKGWIEEQLPARLRFEDPRQCWERYRELYDGMGGVVEAWIEGDDKRSPSVQCRINPLNEIDLISTHDQILGGATGQVFLGCSFPADDLYRLEVQDIGMRVGEVLREHSVLGRYGVDFVSVQEEGRWRHYAIEINLRKGGTTHTFMILQFLTDGWYETETGLFLTPSGKARYYYASDNLKNENYRRFTPQDLVNIVVEHDLHFHGATQEGVFFHLIGALSGYGKLGIVCVSSSPEGSRKLYRNTVEVLDAEASRPLQ